MAAISNLGTAGSRVLVDAPARLHLGFMDLHGGLGRRYGSLGLTLSGISTRVCAEIADAFEIRGEQAERAEKLVRLLQDKFDLPDKLRITIESAIPEHVGLGSGTQLALAVGTAVARLYGLDLGAREIASIFDRGSRSGIGVGAFEQGGFLVDGGRGPGDELPRIVSRLPFPPNWRVILIFDQKGQGLHGREETAAFRTLAPFSPEIAGRLTRRVMMQALPALAASDIREFGLAIRDIQREIGDYFAPAQGGRFASPAVAQVLAWLEGEGVQCVGQSSWGPTGFGIVDSETRAHALVRAAKLRRPENSPLRFRSYHGLNGGGTFESQFAGRGSVQA